MAPEAIRLEGVTKSYGPHRALDALSFSIDAGEAVGYLGPNGAGKTTTLRLLSGLATPDVGTVRVLGGDPSDRGLRALRRLGVLVETPGLVPYLTGRDLLEYVARAKGIPRSGVHQEVETRSAALGVRDGLDRPVGSYSTGLARRLLLAAALVGDPEVLLLDEPTLGLDPAARADLRAVLRGLRREGRTILLSTHLLDDVEEVCSRVLFLRDGRLVGDERVAPEGPTATDGRRTIVVTLSGPWTPTPAWAGSDADVREVRAEPQTLYLSIADRDAAQTECVARLVRAGAPVLSVAAERPTLARRYLEVVGREDAP